MLQLKSKMELGLFHPFQIQRRWRAFLAIFEKSFVLNLS